MSVQTTSINPLAKMWANIVKGSQVGNKVVVAKSKTVELEPQSYLFLGFQQEQAGSGGTQSTGNVAPAIHGYKFLEFA